MLYVMCIIIIIIVMMSISFCFVLPYIKLITWPLTCFSSLPIISSKLPRYWNTIFSWYKCWVCIFILLKFKPSWLPWSTHRFKLFSMLTLHLFNSQFLCVCFFYMPYLNYTLVCLLPQPHRHVYSQIHKYPLYKRNLPSS